MAFVNSQGYIFLNSEKSQVNKAISVRMKAFNSETTRARDIKLGKNMFYNCADNVCIIIEPRFLELVKQYFYAFFKVRIIIFNNI